jgi:hypothetical protein
MTRLESQADQPAVCLLNDANLPPHRVLDPLKLARHIVTKYDLVLPLKETFQTGWLLRSAKLKFHRGFSVMKQHVSLCGQPTKKESVSRTLVPIIWEQWKSKNVPHWRFEADSISVETQNTIEIMRSPPTQGKASKVLRTVVVPIPP